VNRFCHAAVDPDADRRAQQAHHPASAATKEVRRLKFAHGLEVVSPVANGSNDHQMGPQQQTHAPKPTSQHADKTNLTGFILRWRLVGKGVGKKKILRCCVHQ
jgi:pyruvate/2-oxoglutarate dehydrogenase complex dihydrolipoamide acyltransferase (E2) component